ncbi:MAG: hypothetical protein QW578_07325 [Thermoplasmatales archaeon]
MGISVSVILYFWISFVYYFISGALIATFVGSVFTYSKNRGGRIAWVKKRQKMWKLVIGSFISTVALTVISYLLYPLITPYLYEYVRYTISLAILTSTAYFYLILKGFGRKISRNLEWMAGPIILSAVAWYIAYSG